MALNTVYDNPFLTCSGARTNILTCLFIRREKNPYSYTNADKGAKGTRGSRGNPDLNIRAKT